MIYDFFFTTEDTEFFFFLLVLFLSSRGALATKDLVYIHLCVHETLRFALSDRKNKKLRVTLCTLW